MRPLFLALVAPLALTLSTPLSAAADLTTQTDATLSCSDNHSVVMSLDQTALTNLLTDVQAINMSGLMTCDVATAASSQTADWTVYDYNPSGQALAPRHSPNSMPASTTGSTTTFPFKNGVYTALLTTNDASLTGDLSTKTLSDLVSVNGDATSFMTQHNGGDCVSNAPAAVRFFFTAPSASGPSTGTPPAGFYTQFWWSNPENVQLISGSVTSKPSITANMEPNEWSDWNGQGGASSPAVMEAFIEATHRVQSVGLSFGGLCFFETGVTPTNFNSETFSSTFSEN
jgi:hypothetical protein